MNAYQSKDSAKQIMSSSSYRFLSLNNLSNLKGLMNVRSSSQVRINWTKIMANVNNTEAIRSKVCHPLVKTRSEPQTAIFIPISSTNPMQWIHYSIIQSPNTGSAVLTNCKDVRIPRSMWTLALHPSSNHGNRI